MQSIDPRVKLSSIAAFIVVAVSTPTVSPLILMFAATVVLAVLSKIPLKFFLLRSSMFIPIFAGVIAIPLLFITPGRILMSTDIGGFLLSITYEGGYKMIVFTLRVWVCVAFLTLLVLTTRFTTMLHAMESLRLPRLLVMMTSLTYRFAFIFIGEGYRMLLARESRTGAKQKRLETIKSLGKIVGTLFIRSYERGERVYFAMASRGYSGEARSLVKLKLHPRDLVFIAFAAIFCVATVLFAHTSAVGG